MASCELCGLSFRTSGELREHMQQHAAAAMTGDLFECGDCRRSFFQQEDVDRHSRLHTSDQ